MANLPQRQEGSREHAARVLGYHERLAGRERPLPADWPTTERDAYAEGAAAAERQLRFRGNMDGKRGAA